MSAVAILVEGMDTFAALGFQRVAQHGEINSALAAATAGATLTASEVSSSLSAATAASSLSGNPVTSTITAATIKSEVS